jgi:DMSO/TMAO reductase YedYZ molybdopterin-dependent catalytic subunit
MSMRHYRGVATTDDEEEPQDRVPEAIEPVDDDFPDEEPKKPKRPAKKAAPSAKKAAQPAKWAVPPAKKTVPPAGRAAAQPAKKTARPVQPAGARRPPSGGGGAESVVEDARGPGRRLGFLLGALVGLLAGGAGLAVGELAAVFAGGAAAAPAVAVGQKAISLTPRPLEEFAIRNFGSNDKTVLLIGVYVAIALFSAAVGVVARHRLDVGSFLAAGFGAVGVLAAGTQSGASISTLFPSIFGGAAAVVTLRAFTPLGEAVGQSPQDRRRFVLGVLGTAAAAAVGGFGARAWIDSRYNAAPARAALKIPKPTVTVPPPPASVHPNVPNLEPFFTPNSEFYRVDTALTLPQVDPAQWKLRIHGLVDRPMEITFDQLLKMPLTEHDLTLTCVSNPVGGSYCGNARWIGAPLAPILRQAGVQSGAQQILATSTDGMTIGAPVEATLDGREAMLAVAMNGEALPIEHGFPCRMLIPGLYGFVSATKWVVDLELTTWAGASAYWVNEGWSQQAPVKTSSRIDVPGSGASVQEGTVVVAGTAWATHRGIAGVELQVDNGPWVETTLATADTPDTWRQWSYAWTGATKGSHTLTVRATDGTGAVQTSAIQDVAPNGATGYHQISVQVS